jgi:hypothetical protein
MLLVTWCHKQTKIVWSKMTVSICHKQIIFNYWTEKRLATVTQFTKDRTFTCPYVIVQRFSLQLIFNRNSLVGIATTRGLHPSSGFRPISCSVGSGWGGFFCQSKVSRPCCSSATSLTVSYTSSPVYDFMVWTGTSSFVVTFCESYVFSDSFLESTRCI